MANGARPPRLCVGLVKSSRATLLPIVPCGVGFTIPNDELARCHFAATIPTNPGYASLNVAAAVQVVAYELGVAVGEGGVWSAPRFTAATFEEIDALFVHATRTLTAMSFVDPGHPKRLLPRLRRLFNRAGLEREEVNILRGILARAADLVDKVHRR